MFETRSKEGKRSLEIYYKVNNIDNNDDHIPGERAETAPRTEAAGRGPGTSIVSPKKSFLYAYSFLFY